MRDRFRLGHERSAIPPGESHEIADEVNWSAAGSKRACEQRLREFFPQPQRVSERVFRLHANDGLRACFDPVYAAIGAVPIAANQIVLRIAGALSKCRIFASSCAARAQAMPQWRDASASLLLFSQATCRSRRDDRHCQLVPYHVGSAI